MTKPPRPTPGAPFPLGATTLEHGTNFSVVADGDGSAPVELCLIDGSGAERRIEMGARTHGVRHLFVPGVRAGQRYGYRVHAHDHSKLLLDPYARRVTSTEYDLRACSTPGTDTAGAVPVGIVTDGVRVDGNRPDTPWEHTVIYEAHVKGLTAAHPDLPPEIRGSYAGIAHPAVIEYLTDLRVTALELLPVHAHAAEPLLAAAGRPNYWGYSTLSYFAPHPGYASRPGAELSEFAAMVEALHGAGIEVILDVVYNHTCEGGPERPITLSWRGLAPETYYLDRDLTGTGNTIDPGPLAAVRLVTDSLRYWASEMDVDGFRFDLAPVLGRPGGGAFDAASALLTAIEADPVLRDRKLIAEPWDATGDGYALGRFRDSWAEWNDRFRGTVRDFWRGRPGVRDLGYRLTGSEDVFGPRRAPTASINFVTAHDGFTLRDLVSYRRKHNDANGQGGRDGTDDNRSANYGVEGDGDAAHPVGAETVAVRMRQARNLAATVLLSTGTPMLCAGDEMWRTQHGNNNAYCLDSPQVWLDWAALAEPDGPAAAMHAFVRRLLDLRADAPALRQGDFFSGRPTDGGDGVADLKWFAPSGAVMTDADWFDPSRQTLGVWFDGRGLTDQARAGEAADGDSYLLILHAAVDPIDVVLPGPPYGEAYVPVIDTARPTGAPDDPSVAPATATMTMPGRTLRLFRARFRPTAS